MDIVDDLRDLNSMHTPKEASDIGEKAADEIERLRGALKTFADSVKKTNVGIDENWAKTVYPLKAEIERLRQQNAELVEEIWGIALHSGSREANEMARAAIAKATGGK